MKRFFASHMTYEVSRAVDEEHRVAEVVPVTGRILEHEDGVVWQVILVYVRDGLHIPGGGRRRRR